MPKNLTQWLIATLTLIIVGLGTWGLNTLPGLKERVAVAETKVEGLQKQYDRIDKKLDEVLDRLPPRNRRGD